MKPILARAAALLAIPAAFGLTGCAQEDLDYFMHGPADGSYQPANRPADTFYDQQNAAREANMRAVRDQQYKNDMQNYRNGYTNTLPNY